MGLQPAGKCLIGERALQRKVGVNNSEMVDLVPLCCGRGLCNAFHQVFVHHTSLGKNHIIDILLFVARSEPVEGLNLAIPNGEGAGHTPRKNLLNH